MGHHFWNGNARKLGFKDWDYSLISTKNLCQQIGFLALGPSDLGEKMRKPTPIMSPQKIQNFPIKRI